MTIFDILFYTTVYPVQFLIETLFYFFAVYTKTPYVDALFFVSIIINILALPIYNLADKLQEKEKAIQAKLKPKIDDIKAVYKGDKRYMLIRACQRINGYKTIYAFRGTIGLLIQIPFFFAAYNFFSNLKIYNLVSFGAIAKLSEADALIKIGSMSVNLLPFIMTLFSVLSTLVYTKGLTLKEKLPLFAMSAFFLVFLYNSPAVLLIYWTVNCAFSFLKNVVIYFKDDIASIIVKIKSKKKLTSIFYNTPKIIMLIYTIFIAIMTILYFIRPYMVELAWNQGDTFRPLVIHIGTYVDLLAIWIILSVIIVFTLLVKKKIFSFIHNIENKKTFPILITSATLLNLLVGLFIPAALISYSAQEFMKPFVLILTNFSTYTGIFFLYPVGLYFLLSDKHKNMLVFIMSVVALITLLNAFVMVGNYGVINTDITFDNPFVLKASMLQTILNIMLMTLSVVVISIIYKKHKTSIIQNIYIVASLALLFISLYDFRNISREQKLLSEIKLLSDKTLANKNSIFNFSKDGNNIFIIILDRGSPSYFKVAFERMPLLKDNLDGFVWYINNVSFTPYTFPGVQTIYGGYEYMPYELYTNNKNLDTKAIHNEALLVMPKLFSDLGYGATMFNPVYANLSWVPDLSIFIPYTNIKAYNKNIRYIPEYLLSEFYDNEYKFDDIEIEKKENIIDIRAIRFSLFRAIPIFMRYRFYGNSKWHIPSSDDFLISIINNSVKEYLTLTSLNSITSVHSNGNYFNMIHSDIIHEPYNFNSDYKPSSDKIAVPKEDLEFFKTEFNSRSYYSHVASLNALNIFFDYLKENGVYDNTKIIIVSDHGRGVFTPSSFDEWGEMAETARFHHSLLLVKDFNSKEELEINTNFMTIAEVPYLATMHLENPTNPFTGKIITNNQKNDSIVLISTPWKVSPKYDIKKAFKIRDNIFDKNNWEEIEIK